MMHSAASSCWQQQQQQQHQGVATKPPRIEKFFLEKCFFVVPLRFFVAVSYRRREHKMWRRQSKMWWPQSKMWRRQSKMWRLSKMWRQSSEGPSWYPLLAVFEEAVATQGTLAACCFRCSALRYSRTRCGIRTQTRGDSQRSCLSVLRPNHMRDDSSPSHTSAQTMTAPTTVSALTVVVSQRTTMVGNHEYREGERVGPCHGGLPNAVTRLWGRCQSMRRSETITARAPT
jgi:hypothetical protein